jgi:hypothetical protein
VPSTTHANILVPGNALLFRAQGTQMAVVDSNGIVHLRKVVIAQDLGNTLEIESGIEPTDKIIINPSDSIADGDHVQVQQPSATNKGAA